MLDILNLVSVFSVAFFVLGYVFVHRNDKALILLVWRLRRVISKSEAVETVAEKDTVTVTKESDFPQDWWTSEKLLVLENRAIFSTVILPRNFHLMTLFLHNSRHGTTRPTQVSLASQELTLPSLLPACLIS